MFARNVLFIAVSTVLSAQAEESIVLNPIIVTARHTAEALLDVPFTVNSISERQLEDQYRGQLDELLWQTSGVEPNASGAPWQTAIKIRGVGPFNQVSLDDTSVILYEHGVPLPQYKAATSTVDIAQIEVLKGPQGTLYGRNSDAGDQHHAKQTACGF